MMTSHSISIVGLACKYPGANGPQELWENVLSQRRAFRRIPDVRLRLDDYYDPDSTVPDKTYSTQAAVLTGWQFDRVRFRVAGSTFRQTDLTHWLALEVASDALADAGFPDGDGLPRDGTGVLVGNTLTGEFSRAQIMRLRWPYVRRVLAETMRKSGASIAQRDAMIAAMKVEYIAPFPAANEDTLAGGLSNTIAGRICNVFDLHGGGYTLDGACSSSLLAVANACSALTAGDLDAALVGGVDLSIDPFEILGFAKTGALARDDMRVFDARSAGFWPGEGCGFVVLMRTEDAQASGRQIYATITGWGLSSDGSGGMTRPEVTGQRMALARAYKKAGYGPETVGYFEGHGTGTAVGDATELRTLIGALGDAGNVPNPRPVVGSIKALIGHTKAASGIAGLIKSTLALHHRILPPMAGQQTPHPLLTASGLLRTPHQAEAWPEGRPLRASASAMGFGGINAHIAMELTESGARRSRRLRPVERTLVASPQDAELFVIDAADLDALTARIQQLIVFARDLSIAELGDLAATLSQTMTRARYRAAVVASSAAALLRNLQQLLAVTERGETQHMDVRAGTFLGSRDAPARVGFLFPGQGSPANLSGGVWRRRFASVDALYTRANLPVDGDGVSTDVAQPAIATASMAAMAVLEELGIHGDVAVGHSLGELSALMWAETFSEDGLLRTTRARGQAMATLGNPTGAMASISAGTDAVSALLHDSNVGISCHNSPRHTVISGAQEQIDEIQQRAEHAGLRVTPLRVSHAFHSPLVAAAVAPLEAHLLTEELHAPTRPIISTVTGKQLLDSDDIIDILTRQIVEPVRFVHAIREAASQVDLFIEVGPGRALAPLVTASVETPIISLDACSDSLKGLLLATAAVWTQGGSAAPDALFVDRFTRPFSLDWRLDALVNPCERVPALDSQEVTAAPALLPSIPEPQATTVTPPSDADPLTIVRMLVAQRVELPVDAVGAGDRLLSDLHLNSIMVGEIASEAARALGAPPLRSPTEYADAQVSELADALQELVRTGGESPADAEATPPGVAAWVRPFCITPVDETLLSPLEDGAPAGDWRVVDAGHPHHAELSRAAESLPGSGVILCLPTSPQLSHVQQALTEAKALAGVRSSVGFVLVQHGYGAAGIAKTLHLEAPRVNTAVLDIHPDFDNAVEVIIAEARSLNGFVEATYDAQGKRQVPRLTLWTPTGEAQPPLTDQDVVLVTGGGKGITAECALELSQWTCAALAVLGRSDPQSDADLSNNLTRMKAAGLKVRYYRADVGSPEAIASAVASITDDLGDITAVLHGAGRNVPELLVGLDEAALHATFTPKVFGLRNVLDAINPEKLRLLIGFGSIIGRSGMRGNADYAVANEWLRAEVTQWADDHPHCRGLVMEWSVWSGVGMGARLSAIDALARDGITAIPVEEGVAWMRRLLSHKTPPSVVITGRYGGLPTLRLAQARVPFLRFLDNVRTLTPGVEIVVDTELSTHNDPYLNDHVFKGQRLMPAVMGFEAMAQAAQALTGCETPPIIEDVVFTRPIVVPADRPLGLRVAVLITAPGELQAVVRAEDSGFQVDCFQARLRMAEAEVPPAWSIPEGDLEMDVVGDLYGSLLFHEGRFRRVESYREIRGRGCIGRISATPKTRWFASHLSGTLVLGDPGLQDAAIHTHQAAVPHMPLLPRSVDRVSFGDVRGAGPWMIQTREIARTPHSITVDVDVRTMDGQLRERWEGMVLAMVMGTDFKGPWPEPVLGAYLEHRVSRLLPQVHIEAAVAMGEQREERRAQVLSTILGSETTLYRRPDGKPMLNGQAEMSLSHEANLSLAVTAEARIACDIQEVSPRDSATWLDLLGAERLALAQLLQAQQPAMDDSATRVWTAIECLKKAGVPPNAPLTLHQQFEDGWAMLSSGTLRVLTGTVLTRRSSRALAIAIAVES